MSLDKGKALELKLKGNTYSEIGTILGVSRQAVHQSIQALIPEANYIEPFKNNRADILAHVQAKAMIAYLSLDDEEQKEMVKRRGFVDMGIAYDKERLERGLSTGNFAHITADLESIRKAKEDTQEDSDDLDSELTY